MLKFLRDNRQNHVECLEHGGIDVHYIEKYCLTCGVPLCDLCLPNHTVTVKENENEFYGHNVFRLSDHRVKPHEKNFVSF